MGKSVEKIVKKVAAKILNKITDKLTKENTKSDHERLTINIESVENIKSFLAPTYLEQLKKAINKVSIPKKSESLTHTKVYWEDLRAICLQKS